MKFNILFLLLILLSCSNKQEKFNKEKWSSESDRGYYTYRNQMLDDLIENQQLEGKTIEELTELFGRIEQYDTLNNKITFEVLQKWSGVEPVYTNNLILKLDNNKRVKSISFEEYFR